MLRFLILLVIVYMITYEVVIERKIQGQVNGFETQNFPVSAGRSLELFKELQKQGVSDETLMKFATMEDQFLAYEKDAVCRGIDRTQQSIQLSQQIKESFPSYDFSYHEIHIKQISEPNKLINRHLKCL
jgi:hypothetical protein